MIRSTLTRALADEAETKALGRALAQGAEAGDVILLHGDLGAGKSTLARAYIRARAGAQIEAPSPTFTLVQTYDVDPPIWHYDLYRLETPEELLELGFEDSDAGVALVEWPDRLGDRTPPIRLDVRLDFHDDSRVAILTGHGDVWSARLDALRS